MRTAASTAATRSRPRRQHRASGGGPSERRARVTPTLTMNMMTGTGWKEDGARSVSRGGAGSGGAGDEGIGTDVEEAIPAKQSCRMRPPPPPRRPNYFVSARMRLSAEAFQTVDSIHAKLAQLAPELRTAAVGAASAHVTLAVFHLADDAEVERAKAALETLSEHPEMATGGPLRTTLEGLGHFREQVVYVGVSEDEECARLKTLAAAATRAMVAAGVMRDDREGDRGGRRFTPHVTLAKTSQVNGGRGGRRRRPPKMMKMPTRDLVEAFGDVRLGVVEVTRLELCSMVAPKDEDGYYAVCAAVPFAPVTEDV